MLRVAGADPKYLALALRCAAAALHRDRHLPRLIHGCSDLGRRGWSVLTCVVGDPTLPPLRRCPTVFLADDAASIASVHFSGSFWQRVDTSAVPDLCSAFTSLKELRITDLHTPHAKAEMPPWLKSCLDLERIDVLVLTNWVDGHGNSVNQLINRTSVGDQPGCNRCNYL